MFHFEPKDFQPLEQFELQYRWTDAENNTLFPDTALEEIKAFNPDKARQLEEYVHPTYQALSLYLFTPLPENMANHTLFEAIYRLEVEEQPTEEVQNWLSSLGIPLDRTMLLSWDKNTAVTVPWNIFCQYWDDFCYPGEDDICIMSACERWYLLYYHENILLCGRVKSQ